MAYIRVKKISGNNYAYLVESEMTPKGPRQRVKKYLGRVYSFDEKRSKLVAGRGVLQRVVLGELAKYGFKQEKKGFVCNDVWYFAKEQKFVKGKKSVVLALNEGYLCEYTLNKIKNFKKSKDLNKDAVKLANLFYQAGLPISEEDFVDFYQKL